MGPYSFACVHTYRHANNHCPPTDALMEYSS